MLDKIFNRKYLKAMKRLDWNIDYIEDDIKRYTKALHEYEDVLEKRGIKEEDFAKDSYYRNLDYMCTYLEHQRLALNGFRAELITYVS